MGTILASTIVKKSSVILRDEAGRRWRPSELLGWLNDGQREVGILKPDTSTVMQSIIMVAGSEQQIPASCVRLFDISHNAGADGTTVSTPIRLIEKEELDMLDPTWRTAGAANDVIHYVFDGRAPKSWHCYPPQLAGGRYVRAMVQINPTDCTILGVENDLGVVGVADTVIFLDDLYQTALVEYVISRAYDKNDENRDAQRSDMFYRRFLQRLGLRDRVEVSTDPNRNAPPAQQSRQAGGVSQRAKSY